MKLIKELALEIESDSDSELPDDQIFSKDKSTIITFQKAQRALKKLELSRAQFISTKYLKRRVSDSNSWITISNYLLEKTIFIIIW